MHLSERTEISEAVKNAFQNRDKSEFEQLINMAYENNQFNSQYSLKFSKDIIQLLIFNIDSLIDNKMKFDDIILLADNLVEVLKNGLENRKV